MRMKDARSARESATTDTPSARVGDSTDPVAALTGLGLFWMMSPFFLNPPLMVTLLGLPRAGRR